MREVNAVVAMKTYSRDDSDSDREDVRRAISTYKNTCDLPLHVFDDNSRAPYCDFLSEFSGITLHTYSENVGPTENSNRCLSLFRQHPKIDAMILLDDDIEFLKRGWSELYLNGLSEKVQILSFNDPEITKSPRIKNGNYMLSQWSCGVCVTLTRQCWEKAGDYGPLPEKYGWCHIEYYWRCSLLGLVPLNGFYDLPQIEDYLKISSYDGTPEKIRQISVNEKSKTVATTMEKYKAMRTEIGIT